jgi:uncharacterized phage-associated protein
MLERLKKIIDFFNKTVIIIHRLYGNQKNNTDVFQMRDEAAIIQSIHYLLKKLGRTDKLKLAKLIYFADKYHLLKYARQISGDNYQALPYGPIPSGTLDILNFVPEYGISDETIHDAEKLFKAEGDDRSLLTPEAKFDYDSLSTTDIEALDFVIGRFGDKNGGFLIDYSYDFPEWYRHEKEIKEGIYKSKEITTPELLSNEDRRGEKFIPELRDELIHTVREIVSGYY